MNLLITGSTGFIGRNLIEKLKQKRTYKIYTFDKSNNIDDIKNKINDIDFVIHLAGVCKSSRIEDFQEVNVGLTKTIVESILSTKKNIPMIFASSIHAILDTEYGRTKLECEKIIQSNLKEHYIFRFHNLFGKYAKPNSHSVVATFCYNISHNLDITINDPAATIELAYIDEVVKNIIKILEKKTNPNEIMYIKKRYKVSIQELADTIYRLNANSRPQNEFEEKMLETYNYYRNEV